MPGLGRRPPRGFHHFIGHPAVNEGVSPGEVLSVVVMDFLQLLLGEVPAMIDAAVQRDVNGIEKGSHSVLLRRADYTLTPGARNCLVVGVVRKLPKGS